MLRQIGIATLSLFMLASCSNKSSNPQIQIEDKSMIVDNEMYMFVGTYTANESKGIYVYKLDTVTGTSKYISMVEVENPSYLVVDKSEKYIYAVTEDDGVETSAVNAFAFDKEEGKLTFLNKQLTQGGAPCYINISEDGKHVVTANYLGGNISVFPTKEDGSLEPASQVINFQGKGIDADRQNQPHLHCVEFSPNGKYLYADDLGTDKIMKFDVNKDNKDYLTQSTPAFFKVKPGSGPRHITFDPSGKYAYLITELSGEVIAFDYNNGNLNEVQTIKADTLNAKGSGDIHISPDGKFVYASNRLQGDGIAIFSVDQNNGKLTKVGYQLTGIHPRNFAMTPNGKLLLVANRDSDVIQVFFRNAETGLLVDASHDIILDMPVCVKFASVK